MQTSSQKLQQKAIQENPKYNEMVDLGISMEQAMKKAESLPEGEEQKPPERSQRRFSS